MGKLARIERAEAEYMENHKLKEQEAISVEEKDLSSRLGEGEASVEDANTEVKKKKKRKREKDGINDAVPNQELPRCDVMDLVNEKEEGQKPKKSKVDVDDSTLEVHPVASTEGESATKKKKK